MGLELRRKVRMEKYEEKYKGVICTLINEVIGIDKIVQEEAIERERGKEH